MTGGYISEHVETLDHDGHRRHRRVAVREWVMRRDGGRDGGLVLVASLSMGTVLIIVTLLFTLFLEIS